MQLRWGKVDSATLGTGHADTWNLFYQVNSNATGTQVAWQNAGVNYTFDPNGQMNPLIANTTLNNVTVNGIALGTIQIVHGSGGMTQFSDTNGTAQVNLIQQDGFPAGSLQIGLDQRQGPRGRHLFERPHARPRRGHARELQRPEPAQAARRRRVLGRPTIPARPILGAPGKIVGSSLEGSNVDIADEFTKLIVTQQAYSANTRVVTTSNQMVQDVLNMLR